MAMIEDLIAQGYRLEQTHISWVFLGEREVWKIKKPVNFGFLDYSDMEKRRVACEAEVKLNRRFTPEVYLGVVPVALDPQGRAVLGGTGEVVDWAVHMIRLPSANRADHLLETGRLPASHLKGLAGRLASFHASARHDEWTEQFGSPEAVAENVEDNFRQTGPYLVFLLGKENAYELETWMTDYPRVHAGLFQDRVRAGRVRDGHGDLRLSQIYFDGEGRSSILDCIEFSDRFRYGDVASEVSFLSMDLAFKGRADLDEIFLAAYARASGDYDLYAQVDFYKSYRSCVRGKVACLLGEDAGLSTAVREASLLEARRHFRFALAAQRRPLMPPPIIAIGGGIATGKSTLAEAIGERLAAPVLTSDIIRKQRAGLDPWERMPEAPWQGLYSIAFTEKVYAEMIRWAGLIAGSGRPVVLDATFRMGAHRNALRARAAQGGHPFLFLECRADPEVCETRLRQRALSPSISDGDQRVYQEVLTSWEPMPEAETAEHVILDSSLPLEVTLAKAMAKLPSWKRENYA